MSKFHKAGRGLYIFYCPGCKMDHHVRTLKSLSAPNAPVWKWNNDVDSPTITPSLMAQISKTEVCHSFIRNGAIQFLTDSHHELAGQTVELPEYENHART